MSLKKTLKKSERISKELLSIICEPDNETDKIMLKLKPYKNKYCEEEIKFAIKYFDYYYPTLNHSPNWVRKILWFICPSLKHKWETNIFELLIIINSLCRCA